uniref:IRF tryptophan pentad repeat domain-containing protein n=1 Tax=Chelonoidis abingdonii TaxID=106734 RepID=A0A8C0J1S6_CHEAB
MASVEGPLIVPWLRKKLDNGCYPGVRWLDQGRTQFRVPWKHGLRQDASTEDFQLFRASPAARYLRLFPPSTPQDWAIDSGSYRPEHDAPAPSVWKRNFRSALNRKPGIQVLRDHSSDSADPHKVYEILPEGVPRMPVTQQQVGKSPSVPPPSALPVPLTPDPQPLPAQPCPCPSLPTRSPCRPSPALGAVPHRCPFSP